MIAVLAGGVGAARYLAGLVQVVDPGDLVAIVNTGDDHTLHGLRICPDLDTITYTLAGAVDAERGWGLAGETWAAMDALARYDSDRTWFSLGDKDLATHLFRTARLDEGVPLSAVCREVAGTWGLEISLLPMTDDRVETRLVIAEGPDTGLDVSFQDYFVRRSHDVAVRSVGFAGVDAARPAPGVIEAIEGAERIVIAPSNPIVSIGPILAVPGIREHLVARRDAVVAVSPIIAGAAVKGPAARLLSELGHEPSVVGVARLYAPLAARLVIDFADESSVPAIEAAGMEAVVAPTIMHGTEEAAALADVTLFHSGPG